MNPNNFATITQVNKSSDLSLAERASRTNLNLTKKPKLNSFWGVTTKKMIQNKLKANPSYIETPLNVYSSIPAMQI